MLSVPQLALLLTPALGYQEDPNPARSSLPQEDERIQLETTVVTATLESQSEFDLPYSTDVIPAEQISERAYRTLPQILRDQPGVLVQETAHGHGSPYIRGFTGHLNLLLIDGIRLNNSVFRPGPNQYWNTVDALSLSRVEVVKGPASVLYGSDAVGGTVNAFTRSPFGHGEAPALHGELRFLWADAANYEKARAEISATYGPSGGVLIGLSAKDFGDVHGGKQVGLQPETGYDELDGDLKIEHFLSPTTRLTVAHQSVDQRNVPRTHKTIFGTDWEGLSVGSDLRRELDQQRRLTYLQLHQSEMDGFIDRLTTSISYHEQTEDRDRIKSSGAREFQGFDVGTTGVFAHASKEAGEGTWTFGVEYYTDSVDSYKEKLSGNSPADDIQGPVADDATYDQLGVFVQEQHELSSRWHSTLGARWNYASADARSVRDPVTDERIAIRDSWDALVGTGRLSYELDPGRVNVFGGISQGFRAPNLSDLSRFDSAKTNEFEIPAPDLDPEYYTSFELGVKARSASTSTQLSLFHTDVRDKILRVPTGNTNADGEFEVTKDNVGDGYVEGAELSVSHLLADAWSVFGSLTYIDGRTDTFPDSTGVVTDDYIDRLMPTTLQTGLRWQRPDSHHYAEIMVTHAEEADRLSIRDESDSSRIPAGGTPAYTVVDLRTGWKLARGAHLQVGVENIGDEDYRVHGSGLNRPGRNLYFGLRLSF